MVEYKFDLLIDFGQLNQAELADYQRRYGNLAEAQNAMNAEKQREFENRMQRYQMETQLKGAIQENRAATWGDLANFGMGAANLGMSAYKKSGGGGGSDDSEEYTTPQYNASKKPIKYDWAKNWFKGGSY